MLNNFKKWIEYIYYFFFCIFVYVFIISWIFFRYNVYIINGYVRFVVFVEGWGRSYKLIGENFIDYLGELYLGFCLIKSVFVCKV